MGGVDKFLLPLGGRPLIAHTVERLAPQVDALVLNANGAAARFAGLGLPVVSDPVPDFAGPLAGFLAGMRWAESHLPEARSIATVATDTPFFPVDLVARLAAAAGPGRAAVARTAGQFHRVFTILPVSSADDLARFIDEGGSRKVADWLDRTGFVAVDFDDEIRAGLDPFFNINTPEDLRTAEGML
jgi:molybdopterin-guanine dinucleotide biosynthesis protein A